MQQQDHHGNRFSGSIERLRAPERLARLEVGRVVDLAMEGIQVQSVVDIGTGSGIFAEAFANQGVQVTGIDVNPEMLTAARGYVPGGDFRQAHAENLPFPENSFDLVFMGLVLHETDDLDKALQEARRVSRQRLVILEWPYEPQAFGPVMEERLPPDRIISLAQQAGLINGEMIRLQQLALYRFTVVPNGAAS